MKLFQIVSDNGQDFVRSFRLAPHVRALKEKKPDGETYLKVTDVTAHYSLDTDLLMQNLSAAGYSDVEISIIMQLVGAYEGAGATDDATNPNINLDHGNAQ